jgi:transposase
MKKKQRNKFSIEEKERIVLSILEEGYDSYRSVAREFNTCHRLISLWVDSYKVHGRSGLSFKNKLSYTGEFKLSVLQEMRSEGLSLHQLSVKYLISPSVLSTWKHEYIEGGATALFMKKRKGRPPKAGNKQKATQKTSLSDEEKLVKENELLRAENDYLKKLQALIQNQK